MRAPQNYLSSAYVFACFKIAAVLFLSTNECAHN